MRVGYKRYHNKSDWPGYNAVELIARIAYFKDHKTDGRYTSKYLYSEDGKKIVGIRKEI